jgi:hypothetical protein
MSLVHGSDRHAAVTGLAKRLQNAIGDPFQDNINLISAAQGEPEYP